MGVDIFNTTYPLLFQGTTYGQDFFHHLTLKDETTFVALIVMGVIIPGIFIFIFILVCRQRRKELFMRRTQMLLQNAQDFSMDDFPVQDKTYSSTIKL
ncbi:uncharacterized protein LOC112556948 isoform X2 [Pomacea canaliculata]|uniref:uncharacterized protein LOC112556948 isoform X2 n=1 Tax=Pomacea canaliculata TaxID=400727 RepID=UPI000D72572D|nr:uncharacterized protein LOC112556948 isoform X2 [Pomacea canaliculata]